MGEPRRGNWSYLRFVALAAGLTAGLALAGYWPTRRWGGDAAVAAMLAGCGIGLIAAALGAVPLVVTGGGEATTRAAGALGSMVVRFLAALALGGAAAFSGRFENGPLLIWLAISYLGLLVVETAFAIRSLGGSGKVDG